MYNFEIDDWIAIRSNTSTFTAQLVGWDQIGVTVTNRDHVPNQHPDYRSPALVFLPWQHVFALQKLVAADAE